MIENLKKAMKVKKKYFLEEEFWETISKTKKYDSHSATVHKEYQY